MYTVDVLIPTARFAFSVEGGEVRVLPEHRSPEAYVAYRRLRDQKAGGRHDDVPEHRPAARRSRARRVDGPRRPRAAAPERARAQGARDTGSRSGRRRPGGAHARARRPRLRVRRPAASRRRCTRPRSGRPHWPVVAGILGGPRAARPAGDGGELAPGVRWALTPGHTPGGVTYAVDTAAGVVGALRRHRRPGARAFRRHGARARAGGRRSARLVAAHPRLRAAPA